MMALSLVANRGNRGERITSGGYTCSLARTGCTKFWMRLRPLLSVQLRHTLKQSSSRALPCMAACERRRTLRTKVARAQNDHISRGKTSSTSPSRTRASDATDPSA